MRRCIKGSLDRTYVVQHDHGLSPTAIVVADGMKDTVAVKLGNQLLNKEDQEDTTDGGKVEVVDEEQRLELEGLSRAHQLAPTKDDDIVDDDEDGGGFESRHGSLEGHKLELLSRVSYNGLPSFAENGP